MKFVYIKWHRGDQHERRGERKAAIANAHRTVRQRCRQQLREMQKAFDIQDYEIVPVHWYENPPDDTPIEYADDFMHPAVRLGFFD
jgi:hypothetical protein